jgi:hypothetical protein
MEDRKAAAKGKAGTKARKKAAPARSVRKAAAPAGGAVLEDREAMVRLAAYLRAERRGFAPGHEHEDWLAAEAEVNALLAPRAAAKPRKTASSKPAARKPKAG